MEGPPCETPIEEKKVDGSSVLGESSAPAEADVGKSHFFGMFSRDVVYGDSRKGAKQFQEDSFAFFVSPSGRVHAGGVFDGHG